MSRVQIMLALTVVAGLGVLFWVLKPVPNKPVVSARQTEPLVDATARPLSTAASIAASSNPHPTSTTPQVFEFVVQAGKVTQAPQSLQVRKGQNITLRITADRRDALHLHGYDLQLKLRPNEPGQVTFLAEHAGRFGLELHHPELDLGALEVLP